MSEFDNTAIPPTAAAADADPADPGPVPAFDENRPLTGVDGVDRTLGERRVCLDFNPGGDDWVANIKRRAAELIDYIDAIPQPGIGAARWKAEAMTCVETGAMYAVKAATAGQQNYGEGSGYRSVFPVGETTGGTP